jgi:hypothetical protein
MGAGHRWHACRAHGACCLHISRLHLAPVRSWVSQPAPAYLQAACNGGLLGVTDCLPSHPVNHTSLSKTSIPHSGSAGTAQQPHTAAASTGRSG